MTIQTVKVRFHSVSDRSHISLKLEIELFLEELSDLIDLVRIDVAFVGWEEIGATEVTITTK